MIFKYLILACGLFVSAYSFSQSQEKEIETKEITLAVGIDKVEELSFDFTSDVNLADGSLVKVQPDLRKKKITFIGIKPGSTSLTLKDAKGEEKLRYILTITSTDQSKTVNELREIIGGIEGIEIGIRGGRVYVGGRIVVPQDIGKITAVLGSYEGVLNLIELSPYTKKTIAEKMTEELVRNNLKNVTVRLVNDLYWVEGFVRSVPERDFAYEIVAAYLPAEIDTLALNNSRFKGQPKSEPFKKFIVVSPDQSAQKASQQPAPKMIKITTQFVELTKDYAKVFGFKWNPSVLQDTNSGIVIGRNNANLTTSSKGTFGAIINNLFPKIQSLKNAGYGRVIQSGMVIVEEKKKGVVDKNTTVPFSQGTGENVQARTANIQFKLDVTPQVSQEENVKMDVVISVTLPTGQNSDGSPITTSNSIQTSVAVKSRESAAIGGVVQSQSTTAYDRNDPDQGIQNPSGATSNSIFTFLRSKSRNISKSQYVVFITPEIVQSASIGSEEIRKKFRRRRF